MATVDVEGQGVTGSYSGAGLTVLVGIGRDDGEEQVEWLSRKLCNVRLWPGAPREGKEGEAAGAGKPWDRSVKDVGGSVLVISQFTLHGKLKGNKPDWGRAAGPDVARPLYESLLRRLRAELSEERVHAGVFGAMMRVQSENDGPVTLILDSDAK